MSLGQIAVDSTDKLSKPKRNRILCFRDVWNDRERDMNNKGKKEENQWKELDNPIMMDTKDDWLPTDTTLFPGIPSLELFC